MKEILDILSGFKERGIVLSLDDSGRNVKARGNVNDLSASDKVLLKERKDDIVLLLKQARQSAVNIEPLSNSADYALSSSQRRLWLLSQFEDGNAAYNMPGVYVFEGNLDLEALDASFASLIERHESLRTVFRENAQGEVRQVIQSTEASGFTLNFFDFRSNEDREPAVKELVRKDAVQPFDLSAGPLLRAGLYQVEDSRWVFSYVMHHIISDGWSMNILIRELLQFYSAHTNGAANPFTPLRIQYKDYAAWQQQQLRSEELKVHRNYWLKQFEGELPVLELSGDKPRPALKTYNGESIRLCLDAELSRGLKALSQQQGGTLFMTLLAAVNALLYRYTGQEDIIIGSPVAGREHAGLEGQIGFYLNTLALRSRFSGKHDFRQLLHHVKQVALDSYQHQAYPFDELVDNLDLRRDMSRSALFDVMVVLQNNQRDGGDALQNLDGLRVSHYNGGNDAPASKFDLEFDFTEVGNEIHLDLGYNTDIYGHRRIERLAGHLQQLLSAIIQEPGKPIAQLNYMGEEEKRQILQEFNDTFADFPKDKTLSQLFEERAAERPEGIALLFGEAEITYGELNERSNQLAHYLKNKYNIQPEDRLAICLERGPWVIVSVLAVLKAGGAYVPIDTEYPEERIDHMLTDSQSKALINEAELEKFKQEQDRYGRENLQPLHLPSNLAYIIYTSGTTGKPKGVMVEHRSVVNLALAQTKEYSITPEDNILQFSNFAFDVSAEQTFLALTSGARLTLIDKETQTTPEKLETLIDAKGITHVDMVPGMLELLKAKKYSSLKWIVAGGDRCSMELAERWSRYHNFYNSYGPTETTVTAVEFRVEEHHRLRPVLGIGRPLANYQVYIVDEGFNLQPIGVAGEICIGGAGVARGYWNRPELTAEKFVNDPFREGGRIYRTGDVGRWLEDGIIEFIGRKDEQVKIRGYRIELGEIENALHALKGIEAAVVLAKATPAGEKQLVAYLVSSKAIEVQELRSSLGKSLPAYMIPSYFVQLDALPLSPNGKVDRKRLPEPEGLGLSSAAEYIAPRTETEKKLAAIWQDVLGKERIGVKDDFFELGGHSLKASRLTNQVQRIFEVKLTLSAFFENSTLEQQARLIEQSLKTSYTSIEKAPHREYYPLSSAQKRLFFLQEFAPQSTSYNMPMVSYLGKEADPRLIATVLHQLIARHESLRTGFERIDKAVMQKIHSDAPFELDTHECLPHEFEDYFHSYIRPFDLAQAPLLRSSLVHIKEVGYAWIVDLHHIISDGTSHQVLAEDFIRLYRGEELPALSLQYRDFSEWQNKLQQSGELQKQKEYWLSRFTGNIPRLNLPADRPRPSSFSFEGSLYNFTIHPKLTAAVREFCRKNQSTLQMTLLSVLDVLLHKYTGQDDLVIGHGIAGRRHSDLEHIVGMFVNTLAIRSFPEGSKSFQSFHKEVAAACLAAYDNQDIQFQDLVDMLQVERDPSRNPLFDITLVVQNFAESKEDLSAFINPDALPEPLQVTSHVTSKFDMTWFVEERGEDIFVRLEYYSAIYDRSTIERLSHHFINILEAVVEKPELLIAEISMLDAASEKDLLENYASGNQSADPEAIHDFFETQVSLHPHNVALEDAGGPVTYKELNERSGQLAAFLIGEGLKKEDRVAILQSRSRENIVSILGILKAGGAYVPLDSSYPEERLLYMLEDSGATILLVDKSLIELANRLQWRSKALKQLVCIDSNNIYAERGEQSNDLERKELWEHVGDAATDAISAGGWVSSYTGEQISDEEMREFSENAYLKLKPYLRKDMKVLEIGCASGLTLFQVAPHVGAYHATDLSSSILKGTGKAVAEKGLSNVTLSCLSAHEIESLDDEGFDLVIINSVIQNFDGHNYLRDVLVKTMAKMKNTGLLFIGDIMDEERRQALLDDLNAFREANTGKGYRTKTGFSSELFLSRNYLDDLVAEGIGVASAEYSGKIYTIPNELTEFRFDALLKVDKQQSIPKEKKKQQYDLRHINKYSSSFRHKVKSNQLAYIIYTSGSTGRPKGVMVEHRSVVNLVLAQIKEFGITPEENILQFSNLAFDASVEQIFIALTSGARLTLIDKETQMAPERLEELIEAKGITHIHMVPAMLELLEARKYPRLKRVIAGGDRCPKELAERWSLYHTFYNEYGPTETTITSIELKYEGTHRQRPVLGIGRPVANTFAYIVDNLLRLQPVGVIGEICIGGDGLARGYWNQPELTTQKFIANPFRSGERMYRTGDMGRLLDDGTIEFVGRKDDQVKLRGHRIELGEIEHALQSHPAVESCVVITKADRKGEQELIAYITGEQQPGETELRAWLGRSLPGYMIPTHYVHLEALPLNPNGKVNRKALPDPASLGLSGGAEYIAPRNEVEEKLAAIWRDILGKETIGVKDDFFELGGHSLRASRLANQVHRAFEVKLPLNTFFEHPTLEGQARLIEEGIRTAYLAIEKAPHQEYYPLSSAQKRLFFLQEFAPQSTGYNMPMVNYLGKEVDRQRIATVLRQLIARHESLRTSFEKIDGVAMQKIHPDAPFELDTHECLSHEFTDYFHSYIRPFDLSQAPLLRSSLVHIKEVGYAWIVDLHHIISDGTSHQVLADDFLRLYRGEKLSALRLQYRDFSHWQNNLQESGEFQKQKEYWLSRFLGSVPRLSLPTDRPRPSTFSFEGAMHSFMLDKELTAKVRAFCRQTRGTLQMVLLSALNVLFHRYTGQQDITIGCGIAGRRHPDLERIVGMFINTLAIRNYPEAGKTFEQFYKEVSAACLAAYENQDLQFEDLVDMLQVERDPSSNPIFDVALAVQNFTRSQEDKSVLLKEGEGADIFTEGDHRTSKFDMSWFVIEQEDDIYIDLEYYTAIFDASTIERMVRHFTNVLREAVSSPSVLLAQMQVLSADEQQVLLEQYVDGGQLESAPGGSLHELFEKQSLFTPDNIALISGDASYTYKELSEQSNQLAHFLISIGLKKGEPVGVLQSRNKDLIVSLLAILKAGGVYVPLDSDYPEERLLYMLQDTGAEVLLTSSNLIELGNRLQWREKGIRNLICVDSNSIYTERGMLRNELMRKDLWDHVGETATDAISAGGWMSSYTGDYISAEEMQEYSENAFLKLKPYLRKDMKVLEIGCSSGLTMFQVAPHVGAYHGTDLSTSILEGTRKEAAEKGYTHITLTTLPAHDIHLLDDEGFDLVIINSVIQSFDGHNYLRDVLVKVLAKMKDTGLLFIGDIMDEDRRQALIDDLNAFAEANEGKGYRTKTSVSDELFISREYLDDLVADGIGLASAEYTGKIYTIPNELTEFRFDALLQVNKQQSTQKQKRKHQYDLTHISVQDTKALSTTLDNSDTAYMIYTSGSTGKPKGVMVTHGNLRHYLNHVIHMQQGSARIVQPFIASASFDISIFQLSNPLLTGGTCLMLDKEDIQDMTRFATLIKNINVIDTVPAVYSLLANYIEEQGMTSEYNHITDLFIGGDAIPDGLLFRLSKIFTGAAIRVTYGPTEATVFCVHLTHAAGTLRSETKGSVLGRPIKGTSVYITDEQGQLAPIGVTGEICIGGPGVAKGYLNRPELTAENFIENPFRGGESLYKTGDLGRWLPNGNIEFIGRKDNQVKIRGFRIELGEIENVLRKHSSVKEAVVVKTTREGDHNLVAFVVSNGAITSASLRSYLGKSLPAYMVPAHFVQLDALPLTANGKVDRKQLPDPHASGMASGIAYVAPRTATEEKLAQVWQELLGKEKIGAKDNFFESGGHSLKATRLTNHIQKIFGVSIELKELFLHPVLEDQARLIDKAAATSFMAIPLLAEQESYVLSSSQRRLWVLSQFEEANIAYNMPEVYVFEGNLDHKALEASFTSLIERHESLRTTFGENEEGDVRQFIHPASTSGFTLIHRDLRNDIHREQSVKNLVQEDFIQPFDLSAGPLLRASLYRIEEQKWVFTYVIHHIISDGWSMGIFLKELLHFYDAYTKGAQPSLQPLRIQYKDYAAWQQEQLGGENLQTYKNYWLKQFEGELPVLELPLDKPRPAVKTYNGATITRTIDTELSSALKALTRRHDATLFMGLLAAVNTLLYRYTGQQDIIIGSPIAGREHADLEEQIGFYLNTLALRSQFSGEDSYEQLLSGTKELTLKAYEHQAYPFDELVEQLDLQRDLSRNALFDVMVILQNAVDEQLWSARSVQGVTVSAYPAAENSVSKFDLLFSFAETEQGIGLSLQYNSDLFNGSTIERMTIHLEQLLRAIIKTPAAPIGRLDYLPQAEKQHIFSFNNTAADYPKDKTINALFEEQAQKTPDAIALVFEQEHFTWRQLNEQANQLAHYLRTNYHVQPDDRLAISLERSPRMIISLLAVLKSGGAYVPIDPQHPQERIGYMLEDSRSKVLINEEELENFRKERDRYSKENLQPINKSTDLMYVMYTSGSTGKPKGCMLEHRGLVNRIEWMWKEYGFSASDIIMQKTTFTFDVSVGELFMPLCWGARMVLCHRDDVGSPERLLSLIEREQVTYVHFVPGMMQAFISWVSANEGRESLRSLRKVMASGEALGVETVRSWYELSNAPLHNLYGPTEASIEVTHHQTSNSDRFIPIGSPIWNTQLYILDEHRQVQPLGVAGEICIGGEGLARGYWNRPELTTEKFVANPFREGQRIYRTGDLGRWLENGTIEFIGRKDEQVKLRGYRIELGEIESALQSHPAVSSCVVIAKNIHGEIELVAYVTGEKQLNVAGLRAWLGKTLPYYMIPSHYVQLEAFPLTTSGKVDRKQLPDPEGLGLSAGVEYIAPRNEVEEKLVAIWQEILGREKISVKDNFFDLGGHSLKATRLVSRIHKALDVRLALKDLFTAAVLEDQAQLIQQSQKSHFENIALAPEQEDYPLSSSQRRLWVLSRFEEANTAYNMPGVYVFEGQPDVEALEFSLNAVVERHEILRTVFRENGEGEPRQFILAPEAARLHMEVTDLRNDESRWQTLQSLLPVQFNTPFDLSTGPLLRAYLCRVEENRWVFSYVMHHIISDGWSMNIIMKELLQVYNAHTKGETAPLMPLRIQYKDYASWQQQQLSGENLQAHKDYWLKQFEGELPILELPSDKPRPAVKTYNGGAVHLKLTAELSRNLKALSQQQGGTLFMGILAAINTLLYRYTGQEDIIIGSPIAGREHADLEGQIGFYLNTLALRSRFSGEQSFRQLLDGVKQVTLDAYQHQVYPFDELVESLNLRRDTSRSALFDVMVILQNNESDGGDVLQDIDSFSVSGYDDGEVTVSKFDLEFNFTEIEEELHLILAYNKDIYSSSTIERLGLHLQQLLSATIREPQKPIRQLNYLDEKEEQQLLSIFNNTSVDYPRDKTIVELFAEQAQKTPERTALVFEGTEISYRELHERSSQLAHYLKENHNIQPGDRVGIMLDRSDKTIIAILGVLKSGAAYVPIDTDYPDTRKEFIVKDTGIKVLITQSEYIFDLGYFDGGVFAMDLQLDTLETSTEMPLLSITPTSLAYVMYTSGSMGNPKGVMVEHRSVVRLVKSANFVNLTGEEVLLSTGAVSFDATTFEYWAMLLNGGQLLMCRKETLLDSSLLAQEIRSRKVDMMWFTAGWLSQLVDKNIEVFDGLKTLLAGGDKLSAPHIQRLRDRYPQMQIINGYGPTENTTFSLTHDIETVHENIPIGKPISNSTAYILDAQHQPVPVGVSGEICVGGDGLARGYLNNPELTAEKFITVDLPLIGETRLYKTGDLGRWMKDGSIEFMGRRDAQVKIRGFRIELGEIENVLQSHPSVDSAVVIAVQSGEEKELAAYIVSSEELKSADMAAYLGGILPPYMVPAHFVQLEQLPLNSNGKVDRKRLPDPATGNLLSGVEYIAPRNEVEEKLAGIWQEILGRDMVSVKDNFFDLGGHSLKITRLASQLHKEFNVKIELKDLFEVTVLEDQAKLIGQSAGVSFSAIEPVEQHEDYPLSSSQNRLWVLSQFEEANIAYNMPGVLVFEGSLDHKAIEAAFASLIERHDSLRTVFRENEAGEVRQVIQSPEASGFTLNYFDLRNEEDRELKVKDLVQKDIIRPFNLSEGSLLRASIYQIEDSKWVFSYIMHHIISDGWSMNILIRELLQFYNAYAKGESIPLAPLRIQYKDYTAWQQQQLSSEELQAHKDYWLQQFEGELPVLELPSEKPRPAVKTYNGERVHLNIDTELSTGLKTLSQQQGGTLFMGLVAAVKTLLYRYTGQEDIIIGSPIAGREHADLEGQIGFYINTLALRSRFSGNDSFRQLLDHVKGVTLDAYQHQLYPFDELVEALHLRRDMSRSALFDVMVVLQNNENDGSDALQNIDNLRVSNFDGDDFPISKFDLVFEFVEMGDELHLVLTYNSDIYEHQGIERMGRHLHQLLSALLREPAKPVQQLDYLQDDEKHQLLQEFNDTAVDYSQDKTIVDLFEEQAAATPDNIAIAFEDKELSYKELNEQANQLAHYLRSNYGIHPDDLIAVQLERSEQMIVALLAVLKSGGAYVPIDPAYPQERIDYMISDSGCKLVIDEELLESFRKEENRYGSENLSPVNLLPSHLAYVIYTSGTTGKPKGSLIEHRNVVRLFKTGKPLFDFSEKDVWTVFHSFCFDFSVWEMYGALLFGGKTVVVSKAVAQDTAAYRRLLLQHKVTVLNQTPSAFYNLIREELENETPDLQLRYVIFGGEALSPGRLKEWKEKYPATTLVNMYGITETTVHVTYKEITQKEIEENISNIGRPIPTLSCYVLDKNGQLLPAGVWGELYVGGEGVCRGYLNRPELTAQRFLSSPFKTGERLYRSGDRVRLLQNGELEYGGRMDEQVKIRGYRIELGEIESVLQSHPDVESSVVIARSGTDGEKELVAYVVGGRSLSTPELRMHIGATLPAYMIPAHFVQLDKLPLTSNGKVDRKRLPAPEASGFETGAEYIAPRNETEEKLAEIWQKILGTETISVKDNFFELGGHSLRATRLASQIRKHLNVQVPLAELFARPVLEDMAQWIRQATRSESLSIVPVAEQPSYPLSSAQRRLWVLSRFEEANAAYNMPGVYIFEGELDTDAFAMAFQLLIDRHEALRTVFRRDEEGSIRQFIRSTRASGFSLEQQDFRTSEDREQRIKELVAEEISKPFDLSAGPLLRAGLYRAEHNKWVFVYVMHHIISDGWSMSILVSELLTLYNAYAKGEKYPLPQLNIQYKDYASWQQEQLKEGAFNIHRNYWLEQFAELPPVLELPTDKPRPAVKTYNGNTLHWTIPSEISKGLHALSQEQGATLFMGLMAVVNTLLHRYSNQEDIVLGTPIAGRDRYELEDQIGFYLNTLPLRTRFSSKNSYRELLAQVKKVTLDAYEHQSYPFDELVDTLPLQRSMSRSPLFDVMLVLQNNEQAATMNADRLSISAYPDMEIAVSKFDLVFNFFELGNELYASIEYNTDLYEHATAQRMATHLQQLMIAIIEHPSEPIARLDYLPAEEKQLLLSDFNDTAADYPRDKTIVSLFEEQVQRTPEATVLVSQEGSITYRQLNEHANQLARYLKKEYGIRPGDLVAIGLERSIARVVSIMAVIKAGGAYVPIDPLYPQERIEYMLEDSRSKVFINEAELENFRREQEQYSTENLAPFGLTPSDLVYVLYTSGSTGKPKGVKVQHKGLANLCFWYKNNFNVQEEDRSTLYVGVAFDASTWELFPFILCGASLYIVPEDIRLDVNRMAEYYETNGITITFLPTQMGEQFNAAGPEPSSLRYLLVGGEKLNTFTKRSYIVDNSYGPTENTVVATSNNVTHQRHNIPIGKPISNAQVYIVDGHLNLQPLGVPGEICIGGESLSLGYWNRPELTAEKFIVNPFKQGERMYRTGDLGRWLEDGNIEFLGRKDEQVKVRGYRIEPGEIESALHDHPAVSSCVVVAKSNRQGEKELVAYLSADETLSVGELRTWLGGSLPGYMIPSHFVQMDALPLTPNGKIDRRALPDPEGLTMATGKAYVAPRNSTEKKLVAIWQEVLGSDKIGVNDNFFDLGGNSFKIIRMMEAINTTFGKSLAVVVGFKYPNITELAEFLISEDRQENAGLSDEDMESDINTLDDTLQILNTE